MPIRRWNGWAAYCRIHGGPVDLSGDGTVIFEHRDVLRECLALDEFPGVEAAISASCEECCRKRKEAKP